MSDKTKTVAMGLAQEEEFKRVLDFLEPWFDRALQSGAAYLVETMPLAMSDKGNPAGIGW